MHRGSRLQRHSTEAQAARIRTVLDGPDAREAFDKVREEIIRDIESCQLDGSRAAEEKALELIRRLQCFIQFKATLIKPLINERIATKPQNLQGSED